MPSYMLLDIPPDLLTEARAQARTEGCSLSAMMLELLRRGLHPAAAMARIPSEARAEASRANGKLGGRPKRVE